MAVVHGVAEESALQVVLIVAAVIVVVAVKEAAQVAVLVLVHTLVAVCAGNFFVSSVWFLIKEYCVGLTFLFEYSCLKIIVKR